MVVLLDIPVWKEHKKFTDCEFLFQMRFFVKFVALFSEILLKWLQVKIVHLMLSDLEEILVWKFRKEILAPKKIEPGVLKILINFCENF